MKSPLAKKLIKYGVPIIICLLLIGVYLCTHLDLENLADTALVDWYLVLCDAFTVPGMLFFLSGCLMSVSNQGALDGVSYVVTVTVKKLIPGKAVDMERYGDYIARKKEKRVKGYGFLYVIGIVCLVIAGIFMILFYSVLK